ncbi:Tripeptidyl aminopeptidase OS=Streptomyces coelicolor (strain ATCC BAA-471 / A3(2) / M145) GN=tap PE=3 SV=1 [Rhizoctonia solani AG-1 IB]|uniref:Tripeptidyl aminopeptidase n=1 Tax=Thanatephorus cucumeris (strain AG1-IB / isolate 7/3/14) TaxID=1108050 RepID=A0A0B7G6F8_THACB|nr:Tripeptidyl aminopeptidase OS=Streptomyces coelicolor (strain ATCC BAA-471 / A3(2) / M145) GN=tap PE=3 SV=1 [Rhizoctonia solani AG-1 IB]
MYFLLFLARLMSLATADPFKLPTDFDRHAPPSHGIDWQECPGAKDRELRCGRFEVPMDYANETRAGKASLVVIKYPAQNKEKSKLGTLFLNPGGPGKSGVKFLAEDANSRKSISEATGGRYDIVSWDPRGVGETYPRIDCFDNAKQENDSWHDTIPRAGLEARALLTENEDLKSFFEQANEVDRLLQELGERCLKFESNNDTLQYVGTVAIVKDMIALHEYLEHPNTTLNYWGFS